MLPTSWSNAHEVRWLEKGLEERAVDLTDPLKLKALASVFLQTQIY